MTVPGPPAPAVPGDVAGNVVRVTVSAGPRRADLQLPAEVALAEVLPGLARTLGHLDVANAHVGLELLLASGRRLGGAQTLAGAGVGDGSVVSLVAALPRRPGDRYDDVVEAVADVVESSTVPWQPADAARAAVGVAATFLLAGGAVLAASDLTPVLAASLAGGGAVLALVTALALERSDGPRGAGLAVALVAGVLAALAAFLGLEGPARLASGTAAVALTGAGGAALLVCGVLAVGAPGLRREITGLAVTSVLALALGGVTWWQGADAAPVAGVVAFAVLACAVVGVPWLALAATPLRVVTPREDREILDDVPPVDLDAVREQTVLGVRLQVALRCGAGAGLVALVPGVVGTGLPGLLLTVVAFGAVLLSVRESRARGDVAAVTATGATGFLAAILTAALAWPAWRPALVVVLLGTAFAVVVTALLVAGRQLRLARAADVAQLVLLAALPPLAVVAAGAIP